MANSTIKPSLVISSQDKGWRSIIVEEFEQPSGTIASGFWQEQTIVLSLTTCSGRIWQAMDNRSYTGLYTKGDLTVIPAGISGYYKAYNNERYLQIRIPPNLLKQVGRETTNIDLDCWELQTKFRDRTLDSSFKSGNPPNGLSRNPQIEQLAMMLRTKLYQVDCGVGQLYVESLANALVVNLLRNYSGIKPLMAIYTGGLGDRTLLKVTDYIEDRLNQSIKIKDLAAFVDISQFHFSRLFKQSTGKTPHQYIVEQRIELAKRLLKKENRAIADIALDCGFSSQSHLGKYFRQLTGITPKAYRQS